MASRLAIEPDLNVDVPNAAILTESDCFRGCRIHHGAKTQTNQFVLRSRIIDTKKSKMGPESQSKTTGRGAIKTVSVLVVESARQTHLTYSSVPKLIPYQFVASLWSAKKEHSSQSEQNMSRQLMQRRYDDFDLGMEANTAFPSKLFQMLENNTNSEVFGWLSNGQSFGIFDQARFAEILPVYFKHKKLSSFQRQLNLYGFRRDKQQSSYIHPKFQRGRRDLLSLIRRLPNKSAQQNKETSGGGPAGGGGVVGGRYAGYDMDVDDANSRVDHQYPSRISLRARGTAAAGGGGGGGSYEEGEGQEDEMSARRSSRRGLPNSWMNVHHHVTGASGALVKRSRQQQLEDVDGDGGDGNSDDEVNEGRQGSGETKEEMGAYSNSVASRKSTRRSTRVSGQQHQHQHQHHQQHQQQVQNTIQYLGGGDGTSHGGFSNAGSGGDDRPLVDLTFARITGGGSAGSYYPVANQIKRIPLVSEDEKKAAAVGKADAAAAAAAAAASSDDPNVSSPVPFTGLLTKKSKITANVGYFEFIGSGGGGGLGVNNNFDGIASTDDLRGLDLDSDEFAAQAKAASPTNDANPNPNRTGTARYPLFSSTKQHYSTRDRSDGVLSRVDSDGVGDSDADLDELACI
jgi:hypothetical protein